MDWFTVSGCHDISKWRSGNWQYNLRCNEESWAKGCDHCQGKSSQHPGQAQGDHLQLRLAVGAWDVAAAPHIVSPSPAPLNQGLITGPPRSPYIDIKLMCGAEPLTLLCMVY